MFESVNVPLVYAAATLIPVMALICYFVFHKRHGSVQTQVCREQAKLHASREVCDLQRSSTDKECDLKREKLDVEMTLKQEMLKMQNDSYKQVKKLEDELGRFKSDNNQLKLVLRHKDEVISQKDELIERLRDEVSSMTPAQETETDFSGVETPVPPMQEDGIFDFAAFHQQVMS